MIGLAARNFGKLPSELLEISDKAESFDFDLACSLRLAIYDNEREADRFEALKIMLVGTSEPKSGMVKGNVTESTVRW